MGCKCSYTTYSSSSLHIFRCCCPFWPNNVHVSKIDAQLNLSMWIITGPIRSHSMVTVFFVYSFRSDSQIDLFTILGINFILHQIHIWFRDRRQKCHVNNVTRGDHIDNMTSAYSYLWYMRAHFYISFQFSKFCLSFR